MCYYIINYTETGLNKKYNILYKQLYCAFKSTTKYIALCIGGMGGGGVLKLRNAISGALKRCLSSNAN